jgi:putative flippase GtrA
MIRKATSFAVIGLFNTALDAAIFAGLLATATSSLVLANVGAWAVAVSVSYLLNAWFTFAAESGRRFRLRDYGLFVLTGAAGMAAATVTLVAVATVAPVWFAKLCAIAVSFVVNFTLSDRFVFRPQSTEKHADTTDPP